MVLGGYLSPAVAGRGAVIHTGPVWGSGRDWTGLTEKALESLWKREIEAGARTVMGAWVEGQNLRHQVG